VPPVVLFEIALAHIGFVYHFVHVLLLEQGDSTSDPLCWLLLDLLNNCKAFCAMFAWALALCTSVAYNIIRQFYWKERSVGMLGNYFRLSYHCHRSHKTDKPMQT
jgi:hypothetical protein